MDLDGIINSDPPFSKEEQCVAISSCAVSRVLRKAKFPVAFLINTFLERAACYLARDPGKDILSSLGLAGCTLCSPSLKPFAV